MAQHKAVARVALAGYDYDPTARLREVKLSYARRYREQNNARVTAHTRAYYANSPKAKASARERKHRRKALVLSSTHDSSAPAKYKELLTQARVCHWCGRAVSATTMEVDHYIPLSRGGSHTADNLLASCARCNRQRGDRLPGEYAQWLEQRTDTNHGRTQAA